MVKLLLGIDRSLYHVKFGEICRLVDELGFDGIEIQPEHPEIFERYPNRVVPYINDILAKHDFVISFHTPIKDLNIASYNPRIREYSKKEVIESINFANNINAKYIVTHGGKNSFKTLSTFSKRYETLALNYTIFALKDFCKICNDHGMMLSFENMSWSDWRMTAKIEYIKKIFDDLQSTNLKLTLDIDHMELRSKRHVDKIIEIFGDKIISSHIGNVEKSSSHVKKLLKLSNLELLVLEPHSLTYQLRTNIKEKIAQNALALKEMVDFSKNS